MTLTSFALIYLVVWWVVIFAILPIGVKSVHESDEAHPEGVEEGAPVRPALLKKVVITSLVSVVISVPIGMVWPSIDAWLTKEAGINLQQDEAAQSGRSEQDQGEQR
jgi:predicted secreted protein